VMTELRPHTGDAPIDVRGAGGLSIDQTGQRVGFVDSTLKRFIFVGGRGDVETVPRIFAKER
jgi:hypothetical protein